MLGDGLEHRGNYLIQIETAVQYPADFKEKGEFLNTAAVMSAVNAFIGFQHRRIIRECRINGKK